MRNSIFQCLLSFFIIAALAANATDDIAFNDEDNKEMSVSAQELVIQEEAVAESSFYPVEKVKLFMVMKANKAINEDIHSLDKNKFDQTDENKQTLENCRIVHYTSNYL